MSEPYSHLNVSIFKEVAREELKNCLEKFEGTKAIIWDEKILGSIELVADFAFLRHYGVIQMLHLKHEKLPVIRAKNVVYFVRKKASLMRTIAFSLQDEVRKSSSSHFFHILFMPCSSWLCEKILKDEKVFSIISKIHEYPIEILPIDDNVLSMQLAGSTKELLVEKDYSCLLHVARAIMRIQSFFGLIGNIYGLGPCSKRVSELLSKLRNEVSLNESRVVPQINSLLILDRSVDLITPLLTQLTFEGLLDEIYGINNGVVKIPADLLSKTGNTSRTSTDSTSEPKSEMRIFKLNSSDQIFAEIRDKTFYDVGPILKENAKKLSNQMDERHQAKSVEDMRQFMKKLPILQSTKNAIANQTSIAELVKQVVESEEFGETVEIEQSFINCIDIDKANTYIEDCIARQENVCKPLRLMCLQSLVNNGLKTKVLDYYFREILQTYGYKHLVTLNNLEICGLIKAKNTLLSKSYNILKKQFRLTKSKSEIRNEDLPYVYGGYAPISVRIVETFVKVGWKAMTDYLKVLPGPSFESHPPIPSGLRRHPTSLTSLKTNTGGKDEPRVILVFFVGGVTFAEISAFRLLAADPSLNVNFLLATTQLINGKSLIESSITNF